MALSFSTLPHNTTQPHLGDTCIVKVISDISEFYQPVHVLRSDERPVNTCAQLFALVPILEQ